LEARRLTVEKEKEKLEQEIKQKESELQDQIKKIAEKENEIAEKDIKIAEKASEIVKKASEIEEKDKTRQEQAKRIQAQAATVSEKTERIDLMEVVLKIVAGLSLLFAFYVAMLNKALRGKENQLEDIVQEQKGKNKKLDLLLQELNHRIKNNLQTVSSLLSLQFRQNNDSNTKKALREAKNRIQSMGLIHENLYQDENLTTVNIESYIKDLVNNLLKSYGYSPSTFHSSINVQNINIEADTATPIGLIINELVNNCFKHAFENNPNPALHIDFSKNEADVIHLSIKDNGKGLPMNFDLASAKSLGLKLVNLLVDELNGTLKVKNNNGLKYMLTFQN